MKSLSPEMSRLAAVGLLVALVLVIAIYVVLPLAGYHIDRFSEATKKRHLLAQYDFLLSNEAAIDEELAKIEQTDTADLFLAGGKKSIASANLREFVAQAVRESAGELVSSQEYDVEPITSTTAIGLQLQVRGEADSLIGLLHAIEPARPVIFVDELAVSSSSKRSSSSRETRRAQSRGNVPSLDIRMNIVGYLLGEEELPSGSEG